MPESESDARLAWRLFNLNWIPIAAMGGVFLLAMLLAGFSLEPVAFGFMSGLVLLFGSVAYLYAWTRGYSAEPKLIFSMGAISQLAAIVTIMGPLTYVAVAINWPLQDHTFLAVDRAFGMDPGLIAGFVNDHPWLNSFLETVYGFIKWFLIAIPIILAVTLRLVRLQLFVAAFSLTLAVTIAISAFVPAIGTYYGLNVSPGEAFPALSTPIYAAQLRDILALRSGVLHHLELFKLAGVVSFPSFHAASGILYMWALWPVRGFGVLAVAMNVLMIAATPVIGAHYVIDVIGGVLLAALCIVAVKYGLAFIVGRPAAANTIKAGYIPAH